MSYDKKLNKIKKLSYSLTIIHPLTTTGLYTHLSGLRQLPFFFSRCLLLLLNQKPIIIPFQSQIPSNPSMESTIPFSLMILLSSLSLVSTQYVLPDHHFINCGSNSGITDPTGKTFIGDQNPTTFSVSTAENNNSPSNTPPF